MITGNQNPVVGKEEYYQVNSLGLPLFSNNERYVWKIYKKQKSGSWRDITMNPPKTGQRVPFQFGESVAGTEFRLEAWRETRNLLSNEWNRQKTGEMVVIPAQSKTAKITRVVLFNRGARDVNKANYSDTLIAQAHCVAMFNHTVQFQLWEDDAPGSGHDAEINKNNTTRDIFEGRVNARGIAEVRIPLSSNPALLQRIANRYLMRGDQDEGAHHEYYVTASSAGKIGGSSQTNVNVTNPGYKPKPKEDSPKFPATSTSTAPEKPDSESKILDAYFVNSKNQKLVKAAVGNHVQVQIITRNMLGKHVQYKVWEHDTGKHDLVYQSGRIEVKGDIINTSGFTLTQAIFDKGIDFGRFDPDSSSQNYFIEVLPLDVSAESQRFGVTPEALMTVETGKSAAVVREEPRAERKEEKECPNCDKDITLEEIRKICVDTKGNCLIEDDTMIKAALPYLNQYRKKAGINSCVTKAHFLAQISQESKFFQLQERFKYTDPERMRGLFKSYFQQFGSIENQRKEAKRLSDLSLDSKNWEEVANAIYGPAHPIGNASGHGKTDGWRYSGKGFKQITWKDNYNKLQTYVKNNFGLDVKWVDGDNPYKLKWQQADAIISALAYWGKKNISSLAIDTSSKAIENVTLKINSKGEGLDERKRYFKNAVKVLKVNSCKQVENNNLKEKGTVVVVAGKGSKYVSDWLVYETTVYKNITLETFKKLENKEDLPNPDFKLFLSRDAHGDKEKYGKHSDKRYGKANETPPGEYYLIPKISSTQSYKIYISDDGKTPVVNGPHGKRDGLAIHQYNPKYAIGCLTTVSGRDTSKIEELLKHLTDLPLNDDKPVRIIIKERSVKEEKWDNPSVGTTKWTGIL